MDLNPRSRRTAVFALTFVVAFCSIVYELIYSELLTVVFGGTVVRYSVTIGLFLFSFGVGSFLFRRLDPHEAGFFRVEVLLSLVGPLGFLFIVAANVYLDADPLVAARVPLVVSHVPIVAVGVLSGLEVPYLTTMLEADGGEPGRGAEAGGDGAEGGGDGAEGGGDGASDEGAGAEAGTAADGGGAGADGFASVLGMDYVGSLAGTVVYALGLYPALGLVPSVFVLGLLNSLAANAFSVRFRPAGRALFVASLLVTATYAGVVASGEQVEDRVAAVYLEESFEAEYPSGDVEVTVTDRFTTRYQEVVVYERRWTGPPGRWEGPPSETCLRLDSALQLCESWVEAYHDGLVDVPMALRGGNASLDVLLLGGGDWIAADHLREYGVSVDHVDIDRAFMEYAKDSDLLARYHDDAYRYPGLETTAADAYSYLRETDERYDLVLLDLPGARTDDTLRLYSTEFYALLARRLAPGGAVVTWTYSRYTFPAHHEAYLNTVREAGFDRYLRYYSYDDLDGDGREERVSQYYVLATGDRPAPTLTAAGSDYVAAHRDRYADLRWRPVPRYAGVEPNSVFDPNYDIVVEYRR